MIACEAMKKNICICGGGGLGHTVSGYLSSKGFSFIECIIVLVTKF